MLLLHLAASRQLTTIRHSLSGPSVFHSAPTNILFGSTEYFFLIIIFEADVQDYDDWDFGPASNIFTENSEEFIVSPTIPVLLTCQTAIRILAQI